MEISKTGLTKNTVNSVKPEVFLLFVCSFMFLLSQQVNFIIGVFALVFILFKKKGVIHKSPHFMIVLVPMILSLLIGVFNHKFSYSFMRDILYFFSSLVFILLGTQVWTYVKGKINATRLVVSFSVLMTCMSVIQGLLSFASDNTLLAIREPFFGSEVILILGFILLMFDSHKLYSKKVSFLFLIVLLGGILLSFSRTILLLVIVLIPFNYLYFERKIKLSFRNSFVLFVFFCTSIFILTNLDNPAFEPFINKVLNIFSEVTSEKNWNNEIVITRNWRGYEIYVAKTLFENYTFFNKLFGAGLGELFPVQYSNLVGVPVESGGIPIIHNGYYLLLIKSGFFGVVCYITFWMRIIFDVIKKKHQKSNAIFIMNFSLITLISTYVISGMYGRVNHFYLYFFLGLIVCQRNKTAQKS